MRKQLSSFLHVCGRYRKWTALLLACLVFLSLGGCQSSSHLPSSSIPDISRSPFPVSEASPSEFPFSPSPTKIPVVPTATVSSSPIPEDPAVSLLHSMSVEEKIGQLFFIRPDAIEFGNGQSGDGVQSVSDPMREYYAQYPAGGFVLFAKNLKNPDQLRAFTDQLHAIGRIRPLLCIDEEGGSVARIANHNAFQEKRFLNMESIAKTGDLQRAYEVGDVIGTYLAKYGLDIDFAPVVDLNTNPNNPVIGKRAFGNDPVLAGRMAAAVLEGLHAHGIGGCLKHFPGHGDTQTDTHTGYAETEKTWEELLNCEIIPFQIAMQSVPEMIMVAHIAAPSITGCQEPASLSPLLLTLKLRQELAYQGVIITDAMEMKAITKNYSSGDAAVAAIQAGADIVLMPSDYPAAFQAVRDAVSSGELSEERLNESVLRILHLKLSS